MYWTLSGGKVLPLMQVSACTHWNRMQPDRKTTEPHYSAHIHNEESVM